jgi:hypothetical protein
MKTNSITIEVSFQNRSYCYIGEAADEAANIDPYPAQPRHSPTTTRTKKFAMYGLEWNRWSGRGRQTKFIDWEQENDESIEKVESCKRESYSRGNVCHEFWWQSLQSKVTTNHQTRYSTERLSKSEQKISPSG